jgi:hypothetical protein
MNYGILAKSVLVPVVEVHLWGYSPQGIQKNL